MSLNTLRIASALLIASLSFMPAAMVATPAAASDDDVICFDYSLPGGGSETECGTRGDYKAECELVDPDTTTDFCKNVYAAMHQSVNAFAPKGSRGDDDKKKNHQNQDDEPTPLGSPTLEGAAAT